MVTWINSLINKTMKPLYLIIFFLLALTTSLRSQTNGPRFENDTLYTSSGYKIFKGQTLFFGTGLERYRRFKYVTIRNGFLSSTLANSKVIVREIKKYSVSVLGNGYVDIVGYITLKDGISERIILHIAFDRAIENSPALPSEIIVPDEFRNTRPRNIKRELLTAENLYQDELISKEEYEKLRKKILGQ